MSESDSDLDSTTPSIRPDVPTEVSSDQSGAPSKPFEVGLETGEFHKLIERAIDTALWPPETPLESTEQAGEEASTASEGDDRRASTEEGDLAGRGSQSDGWGDFTFPEGSQPGEQGDDALTEDDGCRVEEWDGSPALAAAVGSASAGDASEILDESAPDVREDDQQTRLILFESGGVLYGLQVGHLVEVMETPAVTSVPNLPPWLEGVTNLRGDILAVINLRLFLALDTANEAPRRMLVVRSPSQDLDVGLLVESVEGATHVRAASLNDEATLDERVGRLASGVTRLDGRTLVVLNIELFFNSPEIRDLQLS